MANPRLGHRKSRNGCQQCKKRRVKCDEQKPCGHCKRHNADCSLLYHDPSKSSDGGSPRPRTQVRILPSTARSPSPSGTSVSEASSLSPPQHLYQEMNPQTIPSPLFSNPLLDYDNLIADQHPTSWIMDLELLHHYTVFTSSSLVKSTSRLHVFQVALPQIAFSHDFLMHGILALSALHLAYRRPEKRNEYTMMATHHEQIAIGDFRTALAHVTPDNCHALLALGALLAIIPFASTASQRSPIPIVPSMEEIAQSFNLIQGIKNILHSPSALGIVQNGPLGPLLRSGSPMPVGTLIGLYISELDNLDRLNNEGLICRSMPADHIACSAAIGSLRHTYALICNEDVVREFAVWTWASLVPPRFLDLIRQRYPMAMVILAHFAVLSNQFVESWFLRGWGACVLQGVVGELDAAGTGMRAWVEKPMRWVSEGTPML